jgi:hypothetical protein
MALSPSPMHIAPHCPRAPVGAILPSRHDTGEWTLRGTSFHACLGVAARPPPLPFDVSEPHLALHSSWPSKTAVAATLTEVSSSVVVVG